MWSNLKDEYKILAVIGILFLVVLVVYLININAVDKVKSEIKKDGYTSCNSINYEKGVKYTEHRCNVKDSKDKVITISYPEFNYNDGDFKSLNNILKSLYEESYNSITYSGSSNDLELYTYKTSNYSIYTYDGVLSVVIESKDMIGNIVNKVNSYSVYNIDLTTNKFIDNDSFKERFNIDRSYTTKLKGQVVEWYAVNFKYDYNNELPSYRNNYIDESVKSITYNSLSNLYVDNDGAINFIMSMFQPDFGSIRPYLFTYYNGSTTFKILN